jgi:tripartite-type tricarboxylate transporter receptor subunit TctC
VAQHLTDLLGQSFYVDNRAGAGGVIGAETVVRAPPDGHTLLFSSNTAFSVTPAIKKNLSFDVKRDIAVVSPVARGPQALVVRASLGVNNLQHLIARARREPGKLTIAHSGVGSIIHFVAELFKYHARIDIVQVPYRGGGPSVLGLLAGDVDMMINDLSPVLEHIKAGKLLPLAVASEQRAPQLPDTPTFPEEGLPQVISSSWFCVGAPGATPPEVIATLSQAIGRVLHLPAYRTRLAEFGLEPFELSPPAAAAFIAGELDKWTNLVAAAKIQVD